MKKIILTSLLIAPLFLIADVIPAINSKGGATVLPDGKLKIGKVDPGYVNNLWGVGYFNKTNHNSFLHCTLSITLKGFQN